MTIYTINPKYKINYMNIMNVMNQLLNDISKSINSIYNIVIYREYMLMINNINETLNNYLKIYNFLAHGVKNIYVQIYNQNINLVCEVSINIIPFKYININSDWETFVNGKYYDSNKIVYSELDDTQKNNLRYSIISGDLFFISDIFFKYNNLDTLGIIIKPESNINLNCNCNCSSSSSYNCNTYNNKDYCYITTLYWN